MKSLSEMSTNVLHEPRRAVDQLAARAWPVDDLERRARKVRAVLATADVHGTTLDDLTPAELDAVVRVFGQIETGELVTFLRAGGDYELRRSTESSRAKAAKSKRPTHMRGH